MRSFPDDILFIIQTVAFSMRWNLCSTFSLYLKDCLMRCYLLYVTSLLSKLLTTLMTLSMVT